MVLAPIPVSRYLVPQGLMPAPEGFIAIEEKILGGLPHTITLNRTTELILSMPNGIAVAWRDADPAALVSTSEDELAPHAPSSPAEPVGSVGRAALRLYARLDGVMALSLALRAGETRIVSDGGGANGGSRIEVLVFSWEIHAGSLRGGGDFGSRISLAWRRSDQAVDHFSDPPPHPYVQPRLVLSLPEKYRVESTLGTLRVVPLSRFQYKKVVLR